MPFNIGDRVRCIRETGGLRRESIYTVSRSWLNEDREEWFCNLEGLGSGFYQNRFILVEEVQPEPAPVETREFVHWIVYWEYLHARTADERYKSKVKPTEQEAESLVQSIRVAPDTFRLLAKKKIKVNIPI